MTTSPISAEPNSAGHLEADDGPSGPTPLPRIGRSDWATPRGEFRSNRRSSSDELPPAVPANWINEAVHTACRPAVRRLYEEGRSSLAVTSARRGEGRSTVALGVALVSRTDYARPTVLLELDLEAPSLAERLGLPSGPGLAEVLRGEVTLEDAVVWHDPFFGVLVAGDFSGGIDLTSAFLRSSVLTALRTEGCVTVADLPPLPPQGRADRMAEHFDDVLLVVQAGATELSVVRDAVSSLPAPPDVVLNRIAPPVTRWLHRRRGRD